MKHGAVEDASLCEPEEVAYVFGRFVREKLDGNRPCRGVEHRAVACQIGRCLTRERLRFWRRRIAKRDRHDLDTRQRRAFLVRRRL